LSKPALNPYLALFFGVFAISTGALFSRLAQENDLPSLVIAAGRLTFAVLLLTPFVVGRYGAELRGLKRRDLSLCLLAGGVLGLHFATWISSLEYTSVVASVVLVTTNPLFVALLSAPLLGEKVASRVWLGIGLAFIGGAIVALGGDAGDPPTRPDPLLGNSLALIGSICAALYFLIGRRVREALPVLPYIWLVYGGAAFALILMSVGAGQPFTGYPLIGYVWLLMLALLPQLVGHSSFNYALGYLPAALVSLLVLSEPLGSAILAFLFLGETPTLITLVGAAVILVGIGVANRVGEPD
jgi:drug/metabolite transporter (DMT)-like permease